eukprot:352902-Chlamydomonas_euryale.AAC.5
MQRADVAAAVGAAHADACVPFDLLAGPLLRATLYVLGPQSAVLLVCCHHAVMDGWSSRVLLRQLLDDYATLVAGRPPGSPPPAVQYIDYAAWQRARASSPGWLAGEVEHWRQALLGAPPLLNLPLDSTRPSARGGGGAQVQFEVPAEVARRLRSLASELCVTEFNVLLAAFKASVLCECLVVHRVALGAAERGRGELGGACECKVRGLGRSHDIG